MLAALIILGKSQAVAAPSAKTIEVTDGGEGVYSCTAGGFIEDGFTAITVHALGFDLEFSANKITRKASGTWEITHPDSEPLASGVTTSGKMKSDAFHLSGTLTSTPACGVPVPISIIWQCGNDVVVHYKSEKLGQDFVQSEVAIFDHADVVCHKGK